MTCPIGQRRAFVVGSFTRKKIRSPSLRWGSARDLRGPLQCTNARCIVHGGSSSSNHCCSNNCYTSAPHVICTHDTICGKRLRRVCNNKEPVLLVHFQLDLRPLRVYGIQAETQGDARRRSRPSTHPHIVTDSTHCAGPAKAYGQCCL